MAFEIKEQVSLPMGKCVELVLSGIQYRLFRAAITVAIISLAVAFLMTILGDSLVERQVKRSLAELGAPRQSFLFWGQRLTIPMTESDLAALVLMAKRRDNRWQELITWGGCQDSALLRLQENTVKEVMWLRFFSGLKEGQKRQLVGRDSGRDILKLLTGDEAFQNFSAEIKTLGVEVPESIDDFKRFIDEWNDLSTLRSEILKGHGAAVAGVKEAFGGRTSSELLASLDDAGLKKLTELGFRIESREVDRLKAEAARNLDAKRIEELLDKVSFKQRFALKYDVKDINKVSADMLFDKFSGRTEAKWLLEQKEAAKIGLSQARIRTLSREVMVQRRNDRIESGLTDISQGPGMFGFSTRVQWLIIVSLIVCTVGITNAMLMSVTERFREIATMKCLGATDGFIMINFLLESGLQGLGGGVIGGLLGFLLGIVRASVPCGWMAFQNIPFLEMTIGFFACVIVGIMLSIVAAIYPARVAARLAPMEAMRVE